MIRTTKPKTARSKRALAKKEPKIVENVKTALFIPGSSSNKFLHDCTVDLSNLKKPDIKRFNKKNDILAFEDASKLEFLSEKNDCSLLVLSLKPMFIFNGQIFETHPVYKHLKSLFLDFFRGEVTDLQDLSGLQHMIAISAAEVDDIDETFSKLPIVYFRVYKLKTYKSNQPKIPRVEIDEIGPRLNFKVGRYEEPSAELEKEALARPKQLEQKTKKNVETDFMGDKVAQIHLGKQDLSKLQTRKMKGLKSKYDQLSDDDDDDVDEFQDAVEDYGEEEEEEEDEEEEEEEEEQPSSKRTKLN
ncbi:hypothetical protein PACTADRAFT_47983 [Pachysolen tannophilus NRRL Y-2460]|uniref:Ribosome production factor 2 homolog n=1 Tax=Pachysolen tannophilus NRRL Y-2460 TaxID=669874 RepID=A0A1E4U2G3_PACTA|nr:hypothetical protein PACTADRAFT_47983 [Pachysolen tannophilus NRRL Y-2460]